MDTLPAPTLTPLALLDKALSNGIAPDQLGKLIDLAEQWRKSRAAESWAVAMNRVQAEAQVVVKDGFNEQTKSRYAKLESINRRLVPVYTANGFSLCFGEEDCPREGWTRIIVDVTHRDGHIRRYHKDWPPEGVGIKGNAMMTGTHATGSTISYGRRYLTCMVANVTIADEDNDGNGTRDDSDDPCTEEQLGVLEGLMKQYEAASGKKVNLARALHFIGAADLNHLTQAQRRKLTDDLIRKLAAADAAKAKETAQ